jgi:hypothetical protein
MFLLCCFRGENELPAIEKVNLRVNSRVVLTCYVPQDVMVSILFPYLLPSFPICQQDCWFGNDFRRVLKYLLKIFCKSSPEVTSMTLESFVRVMTYIFFQTLTKDAHLTKRRNGNLIHILIMPVRSYFNTILI